MLNTGLDRMGEISAKTVMADVCRADYHSLCSDTFMMKIMISNNNFKLCCVFFASSKIGLTRIRALKNRQGAIRHLLRLP